MTLCHWAISCWHCQTTTVSCNISSLYPSDVVSHPRRMKSTVTPLRKPKKRLATSIVFNFISNDTFNVNSNGSRDQIFCAMYCSAAVPGRVTGLFQRCCYVTSLCSKSCCYVTSLCSKSSCYVTSLCSKSCCYVTSLCSKSCCYVTSLCSKSCCYVTSLCSKSCSSSQHLESSVVLLWCIKFPLIYYSSGIVTVVFQYSSSQLTVLRSTTINILQLQNFLRQKWSWNLERLGTTDVLHTVKPQFYLHTFSVFHNLTNFLYDPT